MTDSRDDQFIECPRRRTLLRGTFEVALLCSMFSPMLASKEANPDPRKRPPQVGDELVTVNDDGEVEPVLMAAIRRHAAPLMAYPREATSKAVRDRSRLNQILLLHFDPAELSAETRAVAVNGIVAYSGICTHAACGVSEWDAETLRLVCPCHASQYDPRQHAIRVAGPAPRALPTLPLKQVGQFLVVAAPFSGPVGAGKA